MENTLKKPSSTIRIKHRIRNLLFKTMLLIERFRGLDFLMITEPEEVGLDSSSAHRSSPSGNRYLASLLREMKITSNDAIIDIGCGKGNAMRTMLKFPFAQIAGVELSQHIGEIAINNFRRLNTNRTIVHNL